MTTERTYGPSFIACKLWERTSAKGTTYLTGRLGGVRIAIFSKRSSDSDGDGDTSTHVMMFGEAPAYQGPSNGHAVPRPARRSNNQQQQIQLGDDPVPF